MAAFLVGDAGFTGGLATARMTAGPLLAGRRGMDDALLAPRGAETRMLDIGYVVQRVTNTMCDLHGGIVELKCCWFRPRNSFINAMAFDLLDFDCDGLFFNLGTISTFLKTNSMHHTQPMSLKS